MITQGIATRAINELGLEALGLASAELASRWAVSAVTFDAPNLRLTNTEVWRAMASGTLHWRPFGAPELTALDGSALTGSLAVLRLHPQVHLRLARLYALRYDGRNDGRSTRPVPLSVVFHEPDPPPDVDLAQPEDPPPKPFSARVGQELADATAEWSLRGAISFHDERGLIIDPVAVAAAWRDLLLAWPALLCDGHSATDLQPGAAPGGLGPISQGSPGRFVHLVDLHGAPFVAPAPGSGLRIGPSTGGTTVTGAGPLSWPDATAIRSEGTGATPLRWSFATHGELRTDALSIPAFPNTVVPTGSPAPALTRDFFRVTVVHLERHLVGNRGANATEGVPGADVHTRAEEAPAVRDTESLELLVDGQAVLGAMHTARTGRPVTLAASPIVEAQVDLPPDAIQRWPAFPPLPTGVQAGAWDPARAAEIRTSWTARFIGTGNDVELVLPAGIAPREAHVRVFPREFVEGTLAEGPTARRDDGTAVVVGAGDVRIVLRDPLDLGTNERPPDARLRFDVVVVPRPAASPPRARLFGGLVVSIGEGGTDVIAPAPVRSLADVPLARRGESRAPLLGLPPAVPATGSLNVVLQVLSEAEPREAPRFPTMARHDTVLAARTTPSDASAATWESVLSTGWIARRSLRGDARLGNPGNPAGPEEHVVGVRAQPGRLSHDLGRAVLRRTRHLVPRLNDLGSTALALPAAGTGPFAAAVLQTIAPVCEHPEMIAIPDPNALPGTWNALMTALQGILPGLASRLPSVIPNPPAGDRWVAEVKREAMAAKRGRRDAQWALRWQIAHARRLLYIETMLFGHTAEGTADHTWDLVAALAARLAQAPDLRVVIATPRELPFGPGYEGWAKRFYEARSAAINALVTAAPGRVLALHPIGFPGRPEIVRGSVVIADDVWALVGTSTLSRRGLTFDGALDVSLLDRRLVNGASQQIRDLRRLLMARILGRSAPTAGATPDPGWVRLAQMRSAFDLVSETLAAGGEGKISPLWPGPSDGEVLAQAAAIADPEGRDFENSLTTLAALAAALAALGGTRI